MPSPIQRRLALAAPPIIALAVWASTALAESPPDSEAPLGDLSQVGDVGPAPTNVDELLSLDLDDAGAQQTFERAKELILQQYQGVPISEKELYVGALVGMVEMLNRQEQESQQRDRLDGSRNAVLSPAASLYVDQMLRGEKTGIGIEFQANTLDGVLYVTQVYENSPAERNGLRAGDLIVGIDGATLRGRRLSLILEMLRGDQGTPIGLTLIRASSSPSPFSVVLTREEYVLPSVDSRLLDDQVALMRISQFHGRTGKEAHAQLSDLLSAEIDALVLDLRGNQGGLLRAIQDVAALFLEEGTIVGRIQDAAGRERDLVAGEGLTYTGPLICLVDRWTSSGAELLAATLHEHARAVLVGEPTAGKAITESLFDVGRDVSVRLSSTSLKTPLGISWASQGLSPDYLVQGIPLAASNTDSWQGVDVQITFARELLEEPLVLP